MVAYVAIPFFFSSTFSLPQILTVGRKPGVFQHPQAIALKTPSQASMSGIGNICLEFVLAFSCSRLSFALQPPSAPAPKGETAGIFPT
jgi:hypothetical protein